MVKVYLVVPNAFDELLGYVREDGKIYLEKFGLDQHLGEVNLASGKVYAERLGPNREIGKVDLKTGKVYRSRLGFDEYVGKVDAQGRIYQQKPLAPDEYIGKVDHFLSYGHSGGAMLLLVLPALATKKDQAKEE